MSVMTKNPPMKTLMKVTMAMTTVQHRVLRIVWSCLPFSTVRVDCFHGVIWSGVAASSLTGSYDLVLASVTSPFGRRSDVRPFFICYSVKFFHVGLRVSLLVHAYLDFSSSR